MKTCGCCGTGLFLGGARPKASVRERDGRLAIAKFPRKDDEVNTVLWEAVALDSAEKSGINVASGHVEKIGKKPVLILQRFDRKGVQRIPFPCDEHARCERQPAA
jgi:serine/threonine-protein kinase HipA